MSSIALTPAELKEVTGYSRTALQITALSQMEIAFRIRPNGSILVVREDLALTGSAKAQPKAKPKVKQIFNTQ